MSSLGLLSLEGNRLTGGIPPQIASLTNLHELYLGYNDLSWELPAELSSLPNLAILSVTANRLTGELPAHLAALTSLKVLDLSDNQLAGNMPSWLGGFSELQQLGLGRNQLAGHIPAELGNLTKLVNLSLSRNDLTGEIPASLGLLTNLNRLGLAGNQLTGCIPTDLLSVKFNDLFELGLPFCGLPSGTGVSEDTLAAEKGALVTLYNATDGGNWFNNEHWLSDLPVGEWPGVTTDSNGRVTALRFGHSGLAGYIPTELSVLTNLVSLVMEDNELTGTIPLN